MAFAKTYKELNVWKNAMDLTMLIFERSKKFPTEERYSMTDQIRRSSRSIAANIAEGWRKRRYVASFINKLTDAEGEAAETQTWIELARRCGYMNNDDANDMDHRAETILAQLTAMVDNAAHWCIPKRKVEPTS